VRVLLATSNAPGALLIRAVTWSSWSHAALLIDDNHVVEATWPRVRVTPIADVIAKHTDHVIIDLPCKDPDAAIRAALSQVGKPYDWTALAGILVHRDWQQDDMWYCAELVAWCAAQGGTAWFRREDVHRVTQEHLWMLAPCA
jgi:uncharacterized protein YycO